MKVTDIRVWKEDFALTRPYTIAFRTTSHVSNIFVELKTDNGLIGIGAGSPEHFVTGETLENCHKAAAEKAPSVVLNQTVDDNLLKTVAEAFPKTPAALAAVDIALWDLISKKEKKPLAKLLGQKVQKLATSITIGIKPVDEVLAEGKEYVDRGFRIIKLKLGHSLEEDLERAFRLREIIGNQIGLRVDLNQGYNLSQTDAFFQKTEKLNIEFVEQPLLVKEFQLVQNLSVSQRRKIAADEILQTPDDAKALLSPQPWCGIFNIKLMKSGGVTSSKKIAAIAEQNDIDLMWGCMDESKVSIAAALHTAFSSSATKYLDLDGHLDLGRDLVEGGFTLEDGYMQITDKPGIGCSYL